MDTKAAGATTNRLYEDFEPYCKWDEGHETLEIDLKGFKKEQLKVQTNTKGILTIYGERAVEATKNKWCRFRKEIKLSKDTNWDEINAKFSQKGILSISMPKTVQSNPEKTDNEAKPIIQTRKRTTIKVAIGVVTVVVMLVALGTYITRVVNRHHHHDGDGMVDVVNV